MMDLEEDFDSIYRFDIDSRLIALGSRLNFLKTEGGSQKIQKSQILAKKTVKGEEVDSDEGIEDDSDEEDEIRKNIRKRYSDLSPSFANLGRKFLENNKLGRLKHYKAVFYQD